MGELDAKYLTLALARSQQQKDKASKVSVLAGCGHALLAEAPVTVLTDLIHQAVMAATTGGDPQLPPPPPPPPVVSATSARATSGEVKDRQG